MARFQQLSELGLVLVELIDAAVTTTAEIRLAPPIEAPDSAQNAVRISLLWVTPQATHRNDPFERTSNGTLAGPPPTLSAFYLVTTYGATQEGNAINAHNILGDIVTAFHNTSPVALPVDGNGEGELSIIQTTMEPDLLEKIWSPLQVRHRPWLLLDVGPIQLTGADEAEDDTPVVHPGGISIGRRVDPPPVPPVEPIQLVAPPVIGRITPGQISAGGRIRIDAIFSGDLTRVRVGETGIEPPDITGLGDGAVTADLPIGIESNIHPVTLIVGDVASAADNIRIIGATVPSLDAPDVLAHSQAAALNLTGRALGAGAVDIVFWPDAGILSPGDVITVTGTAANTTLQILAADLAPLDETTYRLSMRYGVHGFTPYVLLEMEA